MPWKYMQGLDDDFAGILQLRNNIDERSRWCGSLLSRVSAYRRRGEGPVNVAPGKTRGDSFFQVPIGFLSSCGCPEGGQYDMIVHNLVCEIKRHPWSHILADY